VTTIPLVPPLLAGSSDRPGDNRTGRPSALSGPLPGLERRSPPYLVLLRAGFCLPPVLPRARCALTAPFHPYPSTRLALACASRSGRYVFCATFLQVALTGRYPAHCPAEFGLSSLRLASGSRRTLAQGKPRTSAGTDSPKGRAPSEARSAEPRGGKSELRRAVRRVTPGRGNSKDSGTENIPLRWRP